MSLLPTVGGAVHQPEANKLAGLAAHNRKQRNLPEVHVVADKPTDDILNRQVKLTIRNMTRVEPGERLSAQEAEDKLNAMVSVNYLIRC